MSWLDKSVNENKGIEMIGSDPDKVLTFTLSWLEYKKQGDWFDKRERELQDSIINGTSEIKVGQGLLAYIREQEEREEQEDKMYPRLRNDGIVEIEYNPEPDRVRGKDTKLMFPGPTQSWWDGETHIVIELKEKGK